MIALDASRVPPEIVGKLYRLPVAADTLIYRGALIVLDTSGRAEPGATATGKRAIGVATEYADNRDGLAGAIKVDVKTGIFGFANSADADEITAAQIGHTCYIVDDQTVAKTSGGATRSPAGCVKMIEGGVVFVDVGMPSSIDGDLVAANNLSDVADPDTAADNIGANKQVIGPIRISNLVGADAKVYRFVCPVDGAIVKIHSSLNAAALATGNATLTAKIGGVAVTDGVVTITQAGSAAGDKDSATPSAANTVAEGDEVSITVGGTNTDTAAYAEVTFYIETTV